MSDEIFIDEAMKPLLDDAKDKVLNRDRDFVLVVDGEEGAGKSCLAMQIGKYLDDGLNLDQITFNSDQFIERLKNSKKHSCVILDEAYNAASSRGALTEVNKSLVSVATEMRQRNLFVIIVLPTFFDLDKYFALWRCRGLIHTYFNKKGERGQFVIFPKSHKKFLYLNGKKFYDYSKPKSPYPVCKFKERYPIDKKKYQEKKAEAFRHRSTTSKLQEKQYAQRDALIQHLGLTAELSSVKISELIKNWKAPPLGEREVRRVLEKGRKMVQRGEVNTEEDVWT